MKAFIQNVHKAVYKKLLHRTLEREVLDWHEDGQINSLTSKVDLMFAVVVEEQWGGVNMF